MASTQLIAFLACVGVALVTASYPSQYQPAQHYNTHRQQAYHPTTRRPYHQPRPYQPPTHYRPPHTSYAPGHVTVNQCLCTEKGNKYSPISQDNCRSFSQSTATLPAVVQKCPYGLQFDVKTCVCNWPRDTYCANNCPAPHNYYQQRGHSTYTNRVVKSFHPHQQY